MQPQVGSEGEAGVGGRDHPWEAPGRSLQGGRWVGSPYEDPSGRAGKGLERTSSRASMEEVTAALRPGGHCGHDRSAEGF